MVVLVRSPLATTSGEPSRVGRTTAVSSRLFELSEVGPPAAASGVTQVRAVKTTSADSSRPAKEHLPWSSRPPLANRGRVRPQHTPILRPACLREGPAIGPLRPKSCDGFGTFVQFHPRIRPKRTIGRGAERLKYALNPRRCVEETLPCGRVSAIWESQWPICFGAKVGFTVASQPWPLSAAVDVTSAS